MNVPLKCHPGLSDIQVCSVEGPGWRHGLGAEGTGSSSSLLLSYAIVVMSISFDVRPGFKFQVMHSVAV